jgi:hypothetical protein
MKKKLMIGFIAGTAVFAAVFGAAATLGGITTEDVGADSTTVAACDLDGVTTNYTVVFGATEYEVTEVTVSGIAAACDGQDVTVRSGASEATATITGAATSITLDSSDGWTPLSAASVSDIHVLIQG